METIKQMTIALFITMGLLLLHGCTEHPFDKSEITGGNRQIQGNLTLSDKMAPDGVYVWFESFDISTNTDRDGQFMIHLPHPDVQGTPGGTTGVFKLYFYIANYKLASARAVVRNGEFIFSEGDFDENGVMNSTRSLLKILHVSTSVEPDSVLADYEGRLDIKITLQALFDTVTVIFPKIMGGTPGAVLFRRLGYGDIFVDLSDNNDNALTVERIGPETYDLYMVFDMRHGALPVGRYEVIPYFLIEQENMPYGLLESLSPNAEALGPDYLKIPFKRKGGFLEVFQNY